MSRTLPADRSAGGAAGLVAASRTGLPDGLRVLERPPPGGWDGERRTVVVLVHGALDRATSFARTARRLPEVGVVAYDRRGYEGSRAAGPATSLGVHVEDLLAVAAAYGGAARLCAVGHSIGGTIVLGAAVASASAFGAVGAYEPSMPWLGFRRPGTARPREGASGSDDPAMEAERFFRRIAGDAAWERLSDGQRAARRADGPALREDLRSLGDGAPFDVTALTVRALVAAGGPESSEHHRLTADWLAAHVPAVRRAEVPAAAHGVHLSHPDAFADLVRGVVALAGPEGTGER